MTSCDVQDENINVKLCNASTVSLELVLMEDARQVWKRNQFLIDHLNHGMILWQSADMTLKIIIKMIRKILVSFFIAYVVILDNVSGKLCFIINIH